MPSLSNLYEKEAFGLISPDSIIFLFSMPAGVVSLPLEITTRTALQI
jgi:hypothetical protein